MAKYVPCRKRICWVVLAKLVSISVIDENDHYVSIASTPLPMSDALIK
jgi:hypothetical protein